MQRKVFTSDPYVFDALVFDKYQSGTDNHLEQRKKLAFVYKALKNELTDDQFQCVKEFYIDRRKVKDIASERGVHPSSVSRKIKRATEKIKRIASYY